MPDWNVDAAVGLDDEQAVEADRAAGVRADRDADAARLDALTSCRCTDAFFASHLNISRPLSSASLTNALVT